MPKGTPKGVVPPQLRANFWKKGVSGNPGAVPSRPETIERRKIVENVRQLCKEKSFDAVNALVEVMNSKTAPPSARVVAANSILDRAFGKPQVTVEATVSSFDNMSEKELVAYIAGQTIEGEVMKVIEENDQFEGDLIDEDDDADPRS